MNKKTIAIISTAGLMFVSAIMNPVDTVDDVQTSSLVNTVHNQEQKQTKEILSDSIVNENTELDVESNLSSSSSTNVDQVEEKAKTSTSTTDFSLKVHESDTVPKTSIINSAKQNNDSLIEIEETEEDEQYIQESFDSSPSSDSNGKFYTSSHHSAKYYYPEDCSDWKGLGPKYLKSFSSVKELQARYNRSLSPQCQ